ncbi:MAG: double-strand break repair helicase AddA [Pseudomonadota bacterium]
MSKLTIDDHTQAQQALAADPAHTVWVSANAGSGKTHVLTNRVVRLLLQGAEPSKILCLTFTKTAAAQMSAKVFKQLAVWALMDDAALNKALEKLEGVTPNKARRNEARRLFARALETPGGLNIQTIHAFCERLLHRFPLEANVPGHFQVLDEAEQSMMMAEARTQTQLEAIREPDSAVALAWSAIMGAASDSAFDKVLNDVIKDRERFTGWAATHSSEAAVHRAVKQTLDLPDNETAESVLEGFEKQFHVDDAKWKRLVELSLDTDKITAHKQAGFLKVALNAQSAEARLRALKLALLNKDETFSKTKVKPVNDVLANWPECVEWLTDWASDILEINAKLKAHQAVDNTAHLTTFARAMLARFDAKKRRRGLLDYNDLIEQTANLLTRREARAWVLYKLDMGIDHVLVDEAQDTSPRQWDVIRTLVEEFFSGETARDGSQRAARTMFAVGDEKQSIYSFQGARPHLFSKTKEHVKRLAGPTFEDSTLTLSFRSATDVLELVDHVFAVPGQSDGLSASDGTPVHTAARRNAVGCVDLWPLMKAIKSDEEEDWEKPSGRDRHQAVILADRVAETIHTWVREGVHAAGDIVVLVRSRDRFVPALTRSLKKKNIPVGGADRLKLTDHIAVLDLLALGRTIALPQDDLSFAALLKSPLLNLTEDDLYTLSRGRLATNKDGEAHAGRQTLFDHLMVQSDPRYHNAQTALKRWAAWADSVPVYEFYARILGLDGARARYLERFGYEVEDVLDAFLRLTLNHETAGQPGLIAFLDHVERSAPEIKREMEQAASEVRIMTVHAAKGLEAPVVFLVDKCSDVHQAHHQAALRDLSPEGSAAKDAGYVWIPATKDETTHTHAAKAADKTLAEQEYRRLLYVGMTRARDHLVVCGYKGASPPAFRWHDMVEKGFDAAQAAAEQGGGGAIETLPFDGPSQPVIHDGECDPPLEFRRWRAADVTIRRARGTEDDDNGKQQNAKSQSPDSKLPDWFGTAVKDTNVNRIPLTASSTTADAGERRVGPAANVKPQSASLFDPRDRGVLIHKLLELLPPHPPQDRHALAATHIANTYSQLSQSNIAGLVHEVMGVLDDPRLAGCFDTEISRAEVNIAGSIELTGQRRPVVGIIDRLAVFDDRVVILDYKTGGRIPASNEDVPMVYRRQMALYATVLKTIYPDHPVEAWLIWTGASAPSILPLSDTQMMESLLALEVNAA